MCFFSISGPFRQVSTRFLLDQVVKVSFWITRRQQSGEGLGSMGGPLQAGPPSIASGPEPGTVTRYS